MKVNELNSINYSNKNQVKTNTNNSKNNIYSTNSINLNNSPISNLNRNLINFTALKKSKFEGVDLCVVNKFKAPIEKFNSNEDFQNWCRVKIDEILSKDFKGRTNEVFWQRKSILRDWYNYIFSIDETSDPSVQLLILDGITSNLKENKDSLPPVLNQKALSSVLDTINKAIQENPKVQINFYKEYNSKLQNIMLNESGLAEDYTGWIEIPAKYEDYENFRSNVEKLKMYSNPKWCTKSYMAKDYLREGDFHIYLESGKPKVGIRFEFGEIHEIQGEKNDSKIPLDYLDTIENHIDDEELILSDDAQIQINGADIEKGYISLIDEDIWFSEYDIESLGNVEYITGSADFQDSNIKNLGKLKSINGHANFQNSNITNLGNLKYIGGNANFKNTDNVKSLNNIVVNGDLYIDKPNLLSNVKQVKGSIIISSRYNKDDMEEKYDGSIIEYIKKCQKILKRSFKFNEVANISKERLTDRQIYIYNRYLRQGMSSEEAAYLAAFSYKN